ncbi:hypothetical protein CDAR_51961 [Caerostris darwini]|uniref:Hexosyltransferase n=1 Tax=Caerostris darwini TaxID=1538125 RepID=A0AAV4MPF6_9ARAC|nr:hypothetical protein CDAR_51961 [Caerostris darwini]
MSNSYVVMCGSTSTQVHKRQSVLDSHWMADDRFFELASLKPFKPIIGYAIVPSSKAWMIRHWSGQYSSRTCNHTISEYVAVHQRQSIDVPFFSGLMANWLAL